MWRFWDGFWIPSTAIIQPLDLFARLLATKSSLSWGSLSLGVAQPLNGGPADGECCCQKFDSFKTHHL